MKYKVCPDCGAHLDFGEKCGCRTLPSCGMYRGTADIGRDYLILCARDDGAVSASMRYEKPSERAEHYRTVCCDNPLLCPMRVLSGAVPHDPNGSGRQALAELLQRACGVWRDERG